MSVATVVSLGYGSFGSASLTVTLGYSTQTEVVDATPPDLVPGTNSDLTRRRISFQGSTSRVGHIWKGRR